MKITTRKLAASAVVAAAYAALTMLLAPLSYGSVQFRVSEALCILPALLPCTAWGLFAGCIIANLLSAAGPLDIVFGSLASLGAGLCAAAIGRGRSERVEPAVPAARATRTVPGWGRCIAVCLMPALWNGPVIGAVLSWVSMPRAEFWAGTLLIGAQVAAGELGVLFLLGLPLLRLLPGSKPVMELIDKLEA